MFLRHILTEADGESYDLIRVLAFCFGLAFVIGGLGGFSIMIAYGLYQYNHHALDVGAFSSALATSFAAFSVGCSTLMPAIGFALAKRASGEGPSKPDNPPPAQGQ
jgi:hypothetical protein